MLNVLLKIKAVQPTSSLSLSSVQRSCASYPGSVYIAYQRAWELQGFLINCFSWTTHQLETLWDTAQIPDVQTARQAFIVKQVSLGKEIHKSLVPSDIIMAVCGSRFNRVLTQGDSPALKHLKDNWKQPLEHKTVVFMQFVACLAMPS